MLSCTEIIIIIIIIIIKYLKYVEDTEENELPELAVGHVEPSKHPRQSDEHPEHQHDLVL